MSDGHRQPGLGIIVLGLAALVSVRPLGGELGALERRCSVLVREIPEVQPWRRGAPAPLPCREGAPCGSEQVEAHYLTMLEDVGFEVHDKASFGTADTATSDILARHADILGGEWFKVRTPLAARSCA